MQRIHSRRVYENLKLYLFHCRVLYDTNIDWIEVERARPPLQKE